MLKLSGKIEQLDLDVRYYNQYGEGVRILEYCGNGVIKLEEEFDSSKKEIKVDIKNSKYEVYKMNEYDNSKLYSYLYVKDNKIIRKCFLIEAKDGQYLHIIKNKWFKLRSISRNKINFKSICDEDELSLSFKDTIDRFYLWEREEYNKFGLKKVKAFIFDPRMTIVDSNSIRIKKNNGNVFESDISSVELIKGASDLISNMLVDDRKVYIFSNDLNINKIIDNHQIPYTKFINKKLCEESLNELLSEEALDCGEVVGLSNDEESILEFNKSNINFYSFNIGEGFKGEIGYIVNKLKKSYTGNYYRKWLNNRVIRPDFNSQYFDDVVVYYAFDLKDKKNKNILDLINNPKESYAKKYVESFGDLSMSNKDIALCVPNNHFSMMIVNEITNKYKCNNLNDLIRQTSKSSSSIKQEVSSLWVDGNLTKKVNGATIYLFADLINSGSSMIACLEKLYELNAGRVICLSLGII